MTPTTRPQRSEVLLQAHGERQTVGIDPRTPDGVIPRFDLDSGRPAREELYPPEQCSPEFRFSLANVLPVEPVLEEVDSQTGSDERMHRAPLPVVHNVD